MKIRHSLVTLILATTVVLASGCRTARPRQPIFVAKDFQSHRITEVNMLPVVDARRDTSVALDLQKVIGKPICAAMKKKGYLVVATNPCAQAGASIRDIGEMTPEELCALGPTQAQTLLLVFVEDVYSQYSGLSYAFKVEMGGVLIDKANKQILWRDKMVGNQGQAGLPGVVNAPLNRSIALENAVNGLMKSLPSPSSPSRK